ncbi:MAG TPA: response regulator [Bacillota bacterium]|nr:response regulator [Bacillota bacterium]
MYSVMVVDDEKIIREGIARIIPWEANGFVLRGVADNGQTAWEMMNAEPPKIVITDIKMPGMDGLELISKAHTAFPQIKFVVLSGFGEFELAKTAMRHGVKHYLLKPCNEQRILEVLLELQRELRNDEEREALTRQNRESLEHVLPLVREQFVRDFVAFRHYTQDEYRYYSRLLAIGDVRFNMLLWEPVGELEIGQLFGLIGLVTHVFEGIIYQNIAIKNHVLSLLQASRVPTDFLQRLKQMQREFHSQYRLDLNIAYSDPFQFTQAPIIYQELSKCLKYSLYLGPGSIITPRDLEIEGEATNERELLFKFDILSVAVKSGDLATVRAELERFFQQLRLRRDMNLWKTYITELFMVIIRQCRPETLESYLDKLLVLSKITELEEMQQFIVGTSEEITRANQEIIQNKHHKIIETLLHYVAANIEKEDLSLKRLAAEVVYMNEGYLSKLFLKETGEKFSHYLMRLRMEKAIQMIEKNGADRIYEVAQSVGLGNNPQYFSQLFKKYTGYSPSEYKNRA